MCSAELYEALVPEYFRVRTMGNTVFSGCRLPRLFPLMGPKHLKKFGSLAPFTPHFPVTKSSVEALVRYA